MSCLQISATDLENTEIPPELVSRPFSVALLPVVRLYGDLPAGFSCPDDVVRAFQGVWSPGTCPNPAYEAYRNVHFLICGVFHRFFNTLISLRR